jgi:hypothetical protein
MQDQSKNAKGSTGHASASQSSAATPTPSGATQSSSSAQDASPAQTAQTEQPPATRGGTGGTTQGGGGYGGGGGGYDGGGGGGYPGGNGRPKADPVLTQRLVALEDAIQGSSAVQLKRALNWSGLNENTVAFDSIVDALENSIPPNRPTSDLPQKKSGAKVKGG